jgi:uncharacterized protein YdhG (YjbR/CyaY superfamily)
MPAPAHDHYFAGLAPDVVARMEAIQSTVEAAVPGAERCIGYQMPAYRKGRIFFYFGAFKKHIGIYPPVRGAPDLEAELAPYAGPKGNLIFRHDAELPLDLISRVAQALARAHGA